MKATEEAMVSLSLPELPDSDFETKAQRRRYRQVRETNASVPAEYKDILETVWLLINHFISNKGDSDDVVEGYPGIEDVEDMAVMMAKGYFEMIRDGYPEEGNNAEGN